MQMRNHSFFEIILNLKKGYETIELSAKWNKEMKEYQIIKLFII